MPEKRLVPQSEPASGSPDEVAREILCYLRDHPRAADTLEGITDWWLRRQRLSEHISRVRAAVTLLLGCGAIEKQLMPDDRVIYRVRRGEEEKE